MPELPEVEFGRIIVGLRRHGYKGALTVSLDPDLFPDDVDVVAEARRLRLFLDTLT